MPEQQSTPKDIEGRKDEKQEGQASDEEGYNLEFIKFFDFFTQFRQKNLNKQQEASCLQLGETLNEEGCTDDDVYEKILNLSIKEVEENLEAKNATSQGEQKAKVFLTLIEETSAQQQQIEAFGEENFMTEALSRSRRETAHRLGETSKANEDKEEIITVGTSFTRPIPALAFQKMEEETT